MIDYFLQKWKEPFPDSNSFSSELQTSFGIGLFVTLFLFLIRPFGMHQLPYSSWKVLQICSYFGLVTIGIIVLYNQMNHWLFSIDKESPQWTLGRWFMYTLILILFIALGNFLLNIYVLGFSTFSWNGLFQVIFSTFLVGIFPIVFAGMYSQIQNLKRNQAQAEQITPPKPVVTTSLPLVELPTTTTTSGLEVPLPHLLYIESMQNYVSVCYLKEGKPQRELLRNTLSTIEQLLPADAFLRCHRSFIVNLQQIEHIKGNAQGLKLHLHQLPNFFVPVSRKYIPILKERMVVQ